MARLSVQERDHRAAINACRFMFGCGNGGVTFDEPLDGNELLDALTDDERREQLQRRYGSPFGFQVSSDYYGHGFSDDYQEIPVAPKTPLTSNEKTVRKRNQRRRKMLREAGKLPRQIRSWRE